MKKEFLKLLQLAYMQGCKDTFNLPEITKKQASELLELFSDEERLELKINEILKSNSKLIQE